MHKILEQVDKELKGIEQEGLTPNNLELTSKLLDIKKDIQTIKAMEGEDLYYGNQEYGRGGYNGEYNARGGSYNARGGSYNARGRGGRYRDGDEKEEYIRKIVEGADMYTYGRERYRGGEDGERMHEGLEKMMQAICGFVKSAMDFAETEDEREIIRHHLQKMSSM